MSDGICRSGIRTCILMLFAFVLLVTSSCKKKSVEKQSEQPKQQAEIKADSSISSSNDTAKKIEPAPVAAVSQLQQSAKETAKPKLVPLDIKLPKPMFRGTPQNISVPNLEKPLGTPRPLFYAPEGTTNAALGKPVTSSDDYPIIGEVKMITDGDKEASDGSYVELGPLRQYVTIDLEAEYDIYAVLVWHFHKQAQVYFDVVVQVADDPDFVTNVRTLFNNDQDNSSGLGVGTDMHYVETAEGRLIDGKGVRARYVRLYSNGNSSNDLNHYIEVEVYGKPAK